MVDENSAAGKAGVNAKEDWFLTRVTAHISTKNLLMSMVLGFGEFKSKEDYWKDSKVQNSFQIVTALKLKCALTKHTTTLKKECQLSARTISKISNRHELIREDMSALGCYYAL
jgi:hypothetical protein